MLKIKRLIPVMFFVLAVVPLFSQSDTRYDADKNLPFNEKAGDVNPQTGNIAISATDLSLPGRGGFHFSFGRIWNLNQSNLFSMYIDPDDGSNRLNSNTIEKYNRLGAGWSTNIPYIFKDSSSGELILSLFLGGSVYEIDRDGILKTGSTESNLPGYDLKDKHIEQNRGTSYGDFGLYNLPDLAEEYEIADSETDRSYYLLLLKDNSQYWFREDGRLMMHEDKTGLNRIWYFYDEDARLSLVVDTLGRKISFTYDDAGNLGEVAWQVVTGRMDDREGRSFVEERRSVIYRYKNGEEWEGVNRLKESGQVVSYRPPYILEEVSDPMGNVTRYEWEAGEGAFTFNADDALNTNIFMLLTKIISCYTEDGKYLNQRVMSYEQPLKGAHTKEFYNGFMEYYKISGQYFLDITGRKVNEIRYYYYDNNENGNYNRYSTEITRGNLTTQYTYSLSDDPAKKEVLENISITTLDNFTQITDFTYDAKRRKILEEVTRMGGKIYEEKFNYDDKGNIVRYADRMGLTTTTIYDDKYSIPINQYKTFREGEDEVTYETETVINDLGQVREHYLFLAGENGENRKVLAASIEYDQYGNPVSQTDAEGRTVYTAYDNQYHTFPVKIWQDVDIASWPEGDVHANWQTDPPGMRTMTLRSWKVFNSDGTVWIEVDNEGYALEHYYDKLGTEIRVFNPDQDDLRDFGAADFTDFYRDNPAWVGFLISRENNPGVRMEISYQDDFVKSFTDIDRTLGHVKVAAVQRDGAGNTVKEIEYDADGDEYAVKHMVYDTLGRMIALTDPDAGENSVRATIHGTSFDQYDKTWRVWYDDLGRQKMVKYPSTEKGKVDTKLLRYEDKTNTTIITDPTGRQVSERRDWNGNVMEVINSGSIIESSSPADVQTYRYTYDSLNRKREFTDPMGMVTSYVYDERNLVVEQDYGAGSDIMQYNDLGQLVGKTDRKGQVITFSYDQLGRNLRSDHYKNEEGNLVFSHSVEQAFDNRGNAVRIANSNLVEHYIYDYANRVIKLERKLKDPGQRTLISRIWEGNPEEQLFSFEYSYNDAGIVTSMIYPDGSVHQYTYDPALGRLTGINEGDGSLSLSPFVTGLMYTKSGVVNRMDYANGSFQEWQFDNRKRIKNITIGNETGQLLDLAYTINGSGDILKINDNEYTYDGFDRITGAKTYISGEENLKKLVTEHFGAVRNEDPLTGITYDPLADIYPRESPDGRINGGDHFLAILGEKDNYDIESFEYDRNGNRVKLVQNGDEYTYTYGERNRLERILVKKQDVSTQKLFIEYEYDHNGNTTKRTIYNNDETTNVVTFDYDTLNRLVRTTEDGEWTTYVYDNAGNRLVKERSDGSMTVYLRHGQIAVAMDIEIPNTEETEYIGKINRYVLSGDLLAGRVTKTVAADMSVTMTKSWYHLDHLNSTKCVTNEAGEVEVNYVYRAFGEQLRRLDNDGNETGDKAKYSYGGKELDDGTNLYYFNARFYDATIGRFINVDPVQDGSNWYVYCSNNPLCFVDPTGLGEDKVIETRTRGKREYTMSQSQIAAFIEKGHEIDIAKHDDILGKLGEMIFDEIIDYSSKGIMSKFKKFAKNTEAQNIDIMEYYLNKVNNKGAYNKNILVKAYISVSYDIRTMEQSGGYYSHILDYKLKVSAQIYNSELQRIEECYNFIVQGGGITVLSGFDDIDIYAFDTIFINMDIKRSADLDYFSVKEEEYKRRIYEY